MIKGFAEEMVVLTVYVNTPLATYELVSLCAYNQSSFSS